MQMRKTAPLICIAMFLLLALRFGGLAGLWNTIAETAKSAWMVISAVPKVFVAVFPLLDVEWAVLGQILFGLAVMIAAGSGFYVSIREKKRLWSVISGIVEAVSTVITVLTICK